MSKRTSNFFVSEFYCTKCGKRGFDVPRKAGSQREAGHLKKLYCIYCKNDCNFAEVRPFGDYGVNEFKVEFENGNFTDDGLRKETYRQCLARVLG